MQIETHPDNSVTFAVRVQPRASMSAVAGEIDGAVRVRIAAPPVDGEANRELVRFLAKRLGVARSRVAIVSGATSKTKVVRVTGVTAQECEEAFSPG